MFYNFNRFYRDKEKIIMVDKISQLVYTNKKLDISWDLAQDYSLYGYFARRHSVCLYSPNYENIGNEYLLTKSATKENKVIDKFLVNNETLYLIKY